MTQPNTLPTPGGSIFLTDGGIETDLIFNDGIDLPSFAAFTLFKDAAGVDAIRSYFDRYALIARDAGRGFVLESPTWRASRDWGERLGYSANQIAGVNVRAIELMREVQARFQTAQSPMVISGCIGPRGDGYDPGAIMSVEEARQYHAHQIAAFASAGVDLVTAITMNNTNEGLGVTLAAVDAGVTPVIAFTVETDGRLPAGETLRTAIETVDAATGAAPAYYMINCAHPTHFESILQPDEAWTRRIGGIRANASRKSHAELDESEVLDYGNPEELAGQYAALRRLLPSLAVVGGCCGTDQRHIQAIAVSLA